jgi:hypothetical protein
VVLQFFPLVDEAEALGVEGFGRGAAFGGDGLLEVGDLCVCV